MCGVVCELGIQGGTLILIVTIYSMGCPGRGVIHVKEFCTFDHHRLHVVLHVISMHLCVLGSMPPVLNFY